MKTTVRSKWEATDSPSPLQYAAKLSATSV